MVSKSVGESKPHRYYHRSDIRNTEISEEREQVLRDAFEQTEPASRIWNCVAAVFEIEGDISDSGAVVSSRLHHDKIFPPVGSFSGEITKENEVFASATVTETESGENLACHVTPEKILISRKDDAVSFEAFRDYVLYLESKLNITLNPL